MHSSIVLGEFGALITILCCRDVVVSNTGTARRKGAHTSQSSLGGMLKFPEMGSICVSRLILRGCLSFQAPASITDRGALGAWSKPVVPYDDGRGYLEAPRWGQESDAITTLISGQSKYSLSGFIRSWSSRSAYVIPSGSVLYCKTCPQPGALVLFLQPSRFRTLGEHRITQRGNLLSLSPRLPPDKHSRQGLSEHEYTLL
jgi:hypothetical protein